MAKRTADNQRTKDDDEEENSEEPGVRNTPIAPVQGRVVRGLPKRKGLGEAPAPAPAAPAFGASTPNPFGTLSASAPSAPSSFSFGQSTAPAPAAAPPASNAFSGFSFGAKSTSTTPASGTPPATEASKPESTSTFSFGQKSAETAAPAKASPFSGFSFGAPPAAAPAPAEKKEEAPKAAFSFGNSASNPPAAEKETPKPAPSFGSSTFGSNSASSASKPAFSFGAPSAGSDKKDEGKTSAPAPFSFGTVQKDATVSASKEATQTPAFSFGKPAAPVASGSANSATASKSVPTSTPSVPAPVASTTTDVSSETSFLTSLRGLNHSFQTFFASMVEKDPFIDLSEVLPNLGKQYEKHLEEIGRKSGWKPEKSSAAAAKAVEAPKTGGFTLPKAPESGFALPKPTAPSGAPAAEGFTPSAPASASTTSGFTFPAAPPAKKSSEGATKIVSDVLANKPEEKKAAFSFSIGTDAEKPQGSSAPSTGFSFSAPKKSTSLFSSTPATPAKTSSAESGTPLGKFGPGGSQPQLSFGVKAGTSPSASTAGSFSFSAKPATPAGGTGFSFGSTSSTPSGTPAAAPTSGFSFGSTASTSTFSFGKPAGSAPATAEPAEASEETPGSPSKNLAELAGAGEENEDTVLEQRGKLSRLEDGKYELEGLGQFKLKKEKAEGGKRRLLMRTDGNGNVILNMSFKSTFKPTAEGPYIKFLGFNKDGKPTPYALRVKNAEVAKTVAENLEKEAAEAQ
ncbi:hypothetical protein IAR50_002160 [Cryptococcus sp. DSM 104548]